MGLLIPKPIRKLMRQKRKKWPNINKMESGNWSIIIRSTNNLSWMPKRIMKKKKKDYTLNLSNKNFHLYDSCSQVFWPLSNHNWDPFEHVISFKFSNPVLFLCFKVLTINLFWMISQEHSKISCRAQWEQQILFINCKRW